MDAPTRDVLTDIDKLLRELFSPEELRGFLRERYGDEFADRLPGEKVSRAELSSEATQALARHGHINDAFFMGLAAARPGWRDRIAGVKARWANRPQITSPEEVETAVVSPAAPQPPEAVPAWRRAGWRLVPVGMVALLPWGLWTLRQGAPGTPVSASVQPSAQVEPDKLRSKTALAEFLEREGALANGDALVEVPMAVGELDNAMAEDPTFDRSGGATETWEWRWQDRAHRVSYKAMRYAFTAPTTLEVHSYTVLKEPATQIAIRCWVRPGAGEDGPWPTLDEGGPAGSARGRDFAILMKRFVIPDEVGPDGRIDVLCLTRYDRSQVEDVEGIAWGLVFKGLPDGSLPHLSIGVDRTLNDPSALHGGEAWPPTERDFGVFTSSPNQDGQRDWRWVHAPWLPRQGHLRCDPSEPQRELEDLLGRLRGEGSPQDLQPMEAAGSLRATPLTWYTPTQTVLEGIRRAPPLPSAYAGLWYLLVLDGDGGAIGVPRLIAPASSRPPSCED